ncbi:tellurite resistance TerB family protein [Photobacterium ganghwense]|uniref:tellurite resistance TerB family protein n=1 Tax=Photobacterium ganghwense TaxID=320778 RepID=UPI001A8F158C|nr:TerB family tellurite resistance protein [Photobacterium ganghwense]QSV17137.1 tellurite resistance TerB family protein [Photobacterium ganghwense]
MLGRFFSKKAKAAGVELKRIENRDLMEAIVGGCLLVAAANDKNGKVDESEMTRIHNLIRTNKNLEHFGAEIQEIITRTKARLEASFIAARLEIMREIEDIADDTEQAQDVMANVITVALADGDVDEAEYAVLEQIAMTLGLHIDDWTQ